MHKASISIQIIPLHKDRNSSLQIIDKVIEMIRKSGVTFEVGPMETTMEGELGKLLDIVKKSQKLAHKFGAGTVFTNLKIIYSPKGVLTIDEKVKKFR